MNKNIALSLTVAVLAMTALPLTKAAFSDVPSSSPYADAINYAETNHIVEGYSDGTFKPQNRINRAEFTKIVVGAAKNYNSSQDPSGFDIFSLTGVKFSDVIAGQWYIPYLRKALTEQIIEGYPDGTFKPASDINFAEAAKILANSFNLPQGTDAPTLWYVMPIRALEMKKAIPTTILSIDQKITRGEMIEMIYRLKADITNKPSNETLSFAKSFSPKIGNCLIFPSDNPWNVDVSKYPVDSNSTNYIQSIGLDKHLHPDFGGNGEYGIPYNVVGKDQPKVPLLHIDYADESDQGPYPIPDNAKIENGSDAHVLVVDQDNCKLYELWAAEKVNGGWNAGSAAIFNLLTNDLRPDGWTSADAAGLPVFPGLIRYDEVAEGSINHAIRFTVSKSQKGYIHPATHQAGSSTDPNLPPMGLRVRLKSDYDISGLQGQSKVIAEALKKYGMIVADNGSDWYITGAADPGWDDEDLNQLKSIPGSAFEALHVKEILR